VGRDGGREAQPTAWAATVGHDRPFHSEPERPVYRATGSPPAAPGAEPVMTCEAAR
jgi:hypothetical protein